MYLQLADWQDPERLRERLAETHGQPFMSLSTARTEREIVRVLCGMTGLSAEQVRANARLDALVVR